VSPDIYRHNHGYLILYVGGIINYSLGLCTADREKKIAFSTVKTLVSLLGKSNYQITDHSAFLPILLAGGNITTADDEIVTVSVISFVAHFNDSSMQEVSGDRFNDTRIDLYGHLFRR